MLDLDLFAEFVSRLHRLEVECENFLRVHNQGIITHEERLESLEQCIEAITNRLDSHHGRLQELEGTSHDER